MSTNILDSLGLKKSGTAAAAELIAAAAPRIPAAMQTLGTLAGRGATAVEAAGPTISNAAHTASAAQRRGENLTNITEGVGEASAADTVRREVLQQTAPVAALAGKGVVAGAAMQGVNTTLNGMRAGAAPLQAAAPAVARFGGHILAPIAVANAGIQAGEMFVPERRETAVKAQEQAAKGGVLPSVGQALTNPAGAATTVGSNAWELGQSRDRANMSEVALMNTQAGKMVGPLNAQAEQQRFAPPQGDVLSSQKPFQPPVKPVTPMKSAPTGQPMMAQKPQAPIAPLAKNSTAMTGILETIFGKEAGIPQSSSAMKTAGLGDNFASRWVNSRGQEVAKEREQQRLNVPGNSEAFYKDLDSRATVPDLRRPEFMPSQDGLSEQLSSRVPDMSRKFFSDGGLVRGGMQASDQFKRLTQQGYTQAQAEETVKRTLKLRQLSEVDRLHAENPSSSHPAWPTKALAEARATPAPSEEELKRGPYYRWYEEDSPAWSKEQDIQDENKRQQSVLDGSVALIDQKAQEAEKARPNYAASGREAWLNGQTPVAPNPVAPPVGPPMMAQTPVAPLPPPVAPKPVTPPPAPVAPVAAAKPLSVPPLAKNSTAMNTKQSATYFDRDIDPETEFENYDFDSDLGLPMDLNQHRQTALAMRNQSVSPQRRYMDAMGNNQGFANKPYGPGRDLDHIPDDVILQMANPGMEMSRMGQQMGLESLMDHGAVGSLTKVFDAGPFILEYVEKLEGSLDYLARLLFMLFWKPKDFAKMFGTDDLPQLENKLTGVFLSYGDLVLELRQSVGDK